MKRMPRLSHGTLMKIGVNTIGKPNKEIGELYSNPMAMMSQTHGDLFRHDMVMIIEKVYDCDDSEYEAFLYKVMHHDAGICYVYIDRKQDVILS